MGTLQSKIKEGYRRQQRPIFKTKSMNGIKPIGGLQSKNKASSSTTNREISQRKKSDCSDPLSLTNDSQTSQRHGRNENNSCSYPATAIGLISCRMGQSLKYSTGSLICSNIVLTAAHNVFSFQTHQEASRITFFLNCSSVESQQYSVHKIIIPDQLRNEINSEQQYKKLFQYDYAILMLSAHVDVEKYGTLGFDFDLTPEQSSQNIAVYGYAQRKGVLKIKSNKIKASFSQNAINYSSNIYSQSIGGPIIEIEDQTFKIIGIQNSMHKHHNKSEKKALKLNPFIYDRISRWVTQDQEQIDLRNQDLGKEGIKKFVQLKWTSLTSINLAKNYIQEQGLKYLTKQEWNNLRHFDIGNDIKKKGVRYLIEISMKNLQSLNMWGNGIGAEGASLLLMANWKKLNNINLYNNELGNEGVQYVAKGRWKELENINLGKNNIDDAGMRLILSSPWKKLVSLNLWGNGIKESINISSDVKKHFIKIKFLYL